MWDFSFEMLVNHRNLNGLTAHCAFFRIAFCFNFNILRGIIAGESAGYLGGLVIPGETGTAGDSKRND